MTESDLYAKKEEEILKLSHRYLIFIDEVGDPFIHFDINKYKDLSIFPVMTLTALVVSHRVYQEILMPGLDELKEYFFRDKNILFHFREIRRKDGIFKIFLDEEKYKEFLKIDFPRVPYPTDKKTFSKFVELGKELRELHLLESPKVNQFITTYPIAGSNMVEKLVYRDRNVFINKDQYFGNVPEIGWNFYIGGYQPAQKWLKDRKGRVLSNADIEHYQKVIVVLTETDRIMKEIDKEKFN